MTLTTSIAGQIIFVVNALAALDRSSSHDVSLVAEEERLMEAIFDRADEHGLDTSYLRLWASQNPSDVEVLNNLYARWTNAYGSADFQLPDGASGWLWINAISVSAFFTNPDSALSLV